MVRFTFKQLVLAIVLALLVSLLPVSGFAQATSGDLTGTVTDTSGAIVNDATVTATNPATGFKATTTTVNGEFRLTNLPVGHYVLVVSAANFSSTTLQSVPVELNRVNNTNVQLRVGSASTTVEVSGVAPAIDTTTAQLGTEYSSKLTENLGEAAGGASGVYNLALLAPGVTSGSAMGYGTGPSVGGQRPTNNSFTLEGVDNNDKSVSGPITTVPNDAVAEFSMLQNQFSPEFGHSSGGQFNIVVNSGSNNFHGRLYEYFQNRDLNALDPALAAQGFTSNPRYDQNRFGASVGGPIIKDKLFFFGLAEYNPLGQAAPPATTLCTPSAAGFTALNGIAGLNKTNLSVLEQYLQNLPSSAVVAGSGCAATTTVGGVPIPLAVLSVPSPNWENNLNTVGSIDYNMSSKDQIRGRWIYNRDLFVDNSAASLPVFFSNVTVRAQTVAITEFHTFNPHVTNELRLGFNHLNQVRPIGSYNFPGLSAFPTLLFDDLNQLQIGPNGNYPQGGTQGTYQLSDNVSWVKGRHNFKFGGSIARDLSPYLFVQYLRGQYEYGSLDVYLHDNTPDVFALRGFTSGGNFHGNNWAYAWYVNDVFRLRSNISVNLGLRYEYQTLSSGAALQTLNAINNVPGLITFGKPTVPNNQFMPRIGIAYSPGTSGNTSIRAGFGISYDQYLDNFFTNSLPQEYQFTTGPVLGVGTNFLANGGVTGPAGGGASTSKAATSEFIPNVKNPYAINWNLGVQHVFHKVWTFGADYVGTRGVHLPIQDRLDIQSLVNSNHFLPTFTSVPSPATIAGLTTTLAGLKAPAGCVIPGSCFIVPAYAAAGFTGAGGITAEIPGGWSDYHAMDLTVNRRFTNGLQVLGSYTWSHNIDNSDAMLNTTALNPRRPQDFFSTGQAEKANSLLDRRNRIVAAAVYELPFFKSSSGAMKAILGGWQISPSYVLESPQYATVQSAVDANLNNDSAPDRAIFNPSGVPGTTSAAIPVCAAGVGAVCTGATTVGYVASMAFGAGVGTSTSKSTPCTSAALCGQYIQAGSGALTNIGRNTLALPRTDNVNMSVAKRIALSERLNLQFAAQAFNLFNHPQFIAGNLYDVSATQGLTLTRAFVQANGNNASFDQASTVFSGNPRIMILALKFNF